MRKPRVIVTASIVIILILLFAIHSARPLRVALRLSEAAPLSASAIVTTRVPTRLTAVIVGKNQDDITVVHDLLTTEHQVDILGLYPDYRNTVIFRAERPDGKIHERRRTLRTRKLPDYYPRVDVIRKRPDLIAPGMTFVILGHYNEEGSQLELPSAIDEYGNVRWYYAGDVGHVLRRTHSGKLLIAEGDAIVEIDMLGTRTGRTWAISTGLHHDVTILPNGDLLALTTAPGSFEDGLVEIDVENRKIARRWDYRTILDPDRPRQPVNLEERDWLHLNAVEYDPRTDQVIVSGRDQSAVVSIDRMTGELQWIIGNPEHWSSRFGPYLFNPVGAPFEWQWGQHAPMVHPQDPNRILIYDNGNDRSYETPLLPRQNYSRAVEYEIDPEAMQVRQIWEFGTAYGSELFTPFIGDADYLSNGNRLVSFGGITRTLSGEPTELFDFELQEVRRMKISARIYEVTQDYPAEEVLVFSFADPDPESYRGYRIYRAMRMPLYP